jgi:hypothetical protein
VEKYQRDIQDMLKKVKADTEAQIGTSIGIELDGDMIVFKTDNLNAGQQEQLAKVKALIDASVKAANEQLKKNKATLTQDISVEVSLAYKPEKLAVEKDKLDKALAKFGRPSLPSELKGVVNKETYFGSMLVEAQNAFAELQVLLSTQEQLLGVAKTDQQALRDKGLADEALSLNTSIKQREDYVERIKLLQANLKKILEGKAPEFILKDYEDTKKLSSGLRLADQAGEALGRSLTQAFMTGKFEGQQLLDTLKEMIAQMIIMAAIKATLSSIFTPATFGSSFTSFFAGNKNILSDAATNVANISKNLLSLPTASFGNNAYAFATAQKAPTMNVRLDSSGFKVNKKEFIFELKRANLEYDRFRG